MDRMKQLEELINEFSNTEEQKQEAFKKLEEYRPRINKVISLIVYNRENGKQITVLTSPDFNLTFFFEKI